MDECMGGWMDGWTIKKIKTMKNFIKFEAKTTKTTKINVICKIVNTIPFHVNNNNK